MVFQKNLGHKNRIIELNYMPVSPTNGLVNNFFVLDLNLIIMINMIFLRDLTKRLLKN